MAKSSRPKSFDRLIPIIKRERAAELAKEKQMKREAIKKLIPDVLKRSMKEASEKKFLKINKKGLKNFEKKFPSEESCEKRLDKERWPKGFKCPKCEYHTPNGAYWHEPRRLYQCKNCDYQCSVTTGTLFHKSRTPLKVWFYMIYVLKLSEHKKRKSWKIPLNHLINYRKEIVGKGDHRRTILKMVATFLTEPTKEKNKYMGLVE